MLKNIFSVKRRLIFVKFFFFIDSIMVSKVSLFLKNSNEVFLNIFESFVLSFLFRNFIPSKLLKMGGYFSKLKKNPSSFLFYIPFIICYIIL